MVFMMELLKELWFTRRDLVSDGFDHALAHISKIIPLHIHKIPTGTRAWTWIVPKKWSVKNASIENTKGKRVLDLKNHPLHVASYSLPVNKIVSREELLKHIRTKPERPNAIPYDFKFYQRDWGFCIAHKRLKKLTDSRYKAVINSKFEKGTLKIGDFTIKGATDNVIAIISHLDHPAMANDDLSGVAVAVELAKTLKKQKNNYTFKFLFLPETIGSVAYLSQNEKLIPKVKYALFLEMLGHNDIHSLQLSRQGNTKIDRIAHSVMKRMLPKFREDGFRKIVRNDEMVWNGPGVNIPTISISRADYEPTHYPEYHTSDDTLKIISSKRLY